jgi:hypothetical protein
VGRAGGMGRTWFCSQSELGSNPDSIFSSHVTLGKSLTLRSASVIADLVRLVSPSVGLQEMLVCCHCHCVMFPTLR